MAPHPLAGKPAPRSVLVNVPRLVASYYALTPDETVPEQRVAFGTSGHRGSSLKSAFNEAHILATSQAICDYRKQQGIRGPLFLGKDTHALSEPAAFTAIEVFAANGVELMVDAADGYTATPVVSHAILAHNVKHPHAMGDGVVITPSHNPPEDGGFKYNPPHGGPADTHVTDVIEKRANALLAEKNREVKRLPYAQARAASTTHAFDFTTPYIAGLADVIDLEAIRGADLKIGVDPMGGAGIGIWKPFAERYDIPVTLVNEAIDPTFSFMTLDKDGKIRMDCSSPAAMASLISLKDRFDIAFGNDTDYDRHGIVTKSAGLMNPNHYLAVAIWYLFQHRPHWSQDAAVGKTLVSSSMIDRVAAHLGRRLAEVPVGFKWFVEGLSKGTYGFGGEESAGASFLRKDGHVWTTDKDGIILDLLAAEMTAKLGKDPGMLYQELTAKFGTPVYERIDAPANSKQKSVLKKLSAQDVAATNLAGEPILAKLTTSPEGNAPIGGLKVVTINGWFAARPSGTEDVYKIYAESFLGPDHLKRLQHEAQAMVSNVFKAAHV